MLDTVLGQRGGAPLHFLFAWGVAHLGGGLTALRLVSAAFAGASAVAGLFASQVPAASVFGGTAVAGLLPLRKSVTYHPEPFNWKPAADTCFTSASL